MSLQKQGECESCNQPLYGDDYGAAGHKCVSRPQTTQYDEAAEWKARYEELVAAVQWFWLRRSKEEQISLYSDLAHGENNCNKGVDCLECHHAKLLCEVLGL
jgi:hypothetical protein